MQTLHKTLHKPYISLIIRTLRNVGFMFKPYTNPTQEPTQTLHKSVQKLYTNATQILHGNRHKRNAKPYTKAFKNYTQNLSQSTHQLYTPPTFCFWARSSEGTFMSLHGEKRWRSSAEKTNNFERFFGDSTLTFLTFGNTFLLPILPTRRAVLLSSAPKWN